MGEVGFSSAELVERMVPMEGTERKRFFEMRILAFFIFKACWMMSYIPPVFHVHLLFQEGFDLGRGEDARS